MSDTETEQSFEDLELSDNEYISRKRLQSIQKWYGRVLEREDEIETARVQGQLSNEQADILYKATVNQYVQDALKTLTGKGFAKYVHSNEGNYQLGSVTMEAPTPYDIAWRQARPPGRIGPSPPNNPQEMPPKYSLVNADDLEDLDITIRGLKGFVDAPSEFQRVFSVELDGPSGEETHSIPVTAPMPRHISREAFRTTNVLLNRLDIDIELDAYQHGKT